MTRADRDPTSLDGWTYFSIYRGKTLYMRSDDAHYRFAAGDSEKVWVYDHSFEKLQAQLDEIHAAGG